MYSPVDFNAAMIHTEHHLIVNLWTQAGGVPALFDLDPLLPSV
jgi:hypothetical protein